MKTKHLLLYLALPILFTACSTASPKPPSTIERTFFTVVTNYVPIVTSTTEVLVASNETGVTWVTNVTFETNWAEGYDFEPNTNALAVIETGTAVGNFFGVGGIVGTVLAVLFGVWAKLRTTNALKMAGVLAQIIEAGRKVLSSTPQGQKLETEWVAWMSKHQTQAGVILEVSKLLKQVVDVESAQAVANQLIDLVQKSQPPK